MDAFTSGHSDITQGTFPSPDGEIQEERKFRPVGAMVFFFLLAGLGLSIWFFIYFLMLSRI